ncbi:reverse transcriptase domain-containing protein [Tanacetum coccineum]
MLASYTVHALTQQESVGRPAVASRGEGKGGRASRGSGRTRGRSGDQGDGRIDGQGGQVAQVGDQGRGQGNGRNQNGNAVNDNIWGDVIRGCTYKEFLACNPKEYDGKVGAIVYTCWIEKMESVQDMSGCKDSQKIMSPTMTTQSAGRSAATSRGGGTGGRAGSGGGRTRACNPKEYDGKGGVIVYTRWIKKMEPVQDMSGCRDNQKVKYIAGSFVGKALTWAGHAAYTDRFHELARLVPHLVTSEGKRIERYVYGLASQIRGIVAATEPKTIQKTVQIAGTLTDEALRNGSIKKNPEKRGNEGEPSKDRNVRDNNKRTRTGNAFATTVNPIRGGYTGTTPKCTTCSYHHSPETPCRSCFNCNCLGHFAKDCRVTPRNVNPVNARNPVARTCFEFVSTDHIKSAYPRLNQA